MNEEKTCRCSGFCGGHPHEAHGLPGTAKPGTEWTEPEQGATVEELEVAVEDQVRDIDKARDLLNVLFDKSKSASHRTNLRLTGSPLTAEDLKRIAECK